MTPSRNNRSYTSLCTIVPQSFFHLAFTFFSLVFMRFFVILPLLSSRQILFLQWPRILLFKQASWNTYFSLGTCILFLGHVSYSLEQVSYSWNTYLTLWNMYLILGTCIFLFGTCILFLEHVSYSLEQVCHLHKKSTSPLIKDEGPPG